VVVEEGLTVRVAVNVETVCTTPSDQVTVNGPVSPLMVAVMVPGAPGQEAPPPLTTAESGAAGVTVALPLDVPPVQRVSRSDVTV
jgi:hypothetical protein